MACAAVSKDTHQVVRGALPSVTTLHIQHPSQLRLVGVLAELLCDVRTIYITIDWDSETATQVLSFLSNFRQLKRVLFGHFESNGEFRYLSTTFENLSEETKQCLKQFIFAISGGYISGGFASDVEFIGLCCPHRSNQMFIFGSNHRETQVRTFHSLGCEMCRWVYRSFPIDKALVFPCCLPREEILNIIKSRPEGQGYLLSLIFATQEAEMERKFEDLRNQTEDLHNQQETLARQKERAPINKAFLQDTKKHEVVEQNEVFPHGPKVSPHNMEAWALVQKDIVEIFPDLDEKLLDKMG